MLRSLSGRPELAFALLLALGTACHSSADDDHTGAAGSASSSGGTGGESGGSGGAPAGGASNAGSAGTTVNAAGTAGSVAETDPVPPGKPCDTALLCDDFESYDSAPNGKWTLHTSAGGAVVIDTTQHASGAKSVKVSTQASSSVTAMLRMQDPSVFPVPGNVVYGRMLYYLESAPTQSVHWTLIAGLGVVPGQTYHAVYRYGGQTPLTQGTTFLGSEMMANYDTPDWYSDKSTPGSDCWHHANGRVMPVGKWTCIEWKFDGPNDGMKLWLDGVAATDLTIMGHGDGNNQDGCVNANNDSPWAAPTFASFDLGWESYQTDDARTAYIDDVAISTTRLGCPQ